MSKYAVKLRALEADDMDFIEHLYATSRADEMSHSGWPAEQIAAFLKMQFHAQHVYYQEHFAGSDFLIIEVEAQRVGRIYTWFGKTCVTLIDIALLPEFQKNGIGSELLEDLLCRADESELPIELSVEPYNPALKLYERFGFQVINQTGVYLRMRREVPSHSSRMSV
ncbi:GNAT family N-acetyltransferase [Pseudomonas sp. FFUP_PS_473]|uniref:GNAT family N-acetyltransferase n=1 Tax=Pseudomonas sp. FFUP_PS_473 TaxID=2060418 RepID=UPI000C7C1ED9|nr:GNAT family N-acetyltransferase [Pseudomonas sp. FFUP_PS_473]PLP95596.1 GNAT family N-acetyltransferase [Pseudomonas sp. FFUP_PS_473]